MDVLSGYLDGLPSVIAFVDPVNRNPGNVNFDLIRHMDTSSYQIKREYRVSLERRAVASRELNRSLAR
jgi:hypothetical protein